MLVADPLIRAEQANPLGNGFVNEALKGRGPHIGDDAGHDVALAADCADKWRLTGADTARAATAAALVLVAVLGEPADERLLHLHNAEELAEVAILEADADAMAHVPSGLVGADVHGPIELKGRDAFL